MNDLVSIIMPSFNTASFILQTITSVINQTYTKWELIIVDDKSTDLSVEIINNVNDVRIKLIENAINMGAAYSRNIALQMAKGEWIAFLDSDDLWYPKKLERQLEFMKNKNYYFSYTEYDEISDKNIKLNKRNTGPKVITKFKMSNYCYPGCLTVMYNRSNTGLIQIPNLKKNNDYSIWLKIVKKHNCHLLPEVLASYRRREGSISNQRISVLIKHHFIMWRLSENKSVFSSIFFTFRNIFFGILKKIYYVRKEIEHSE